MSDAVLPEVKAADAPLPPEWSPGSGYQIFACLLWFVAAGLLWWALASPTSVAISSYDETMARIDPVKYPLPSSITNLSLLQQQILIFLAAGFTAVAGALLFATGAVVKAILSTRENGR